MVSNYQTIYEDKTIGNYYQDLARILSVIKDNKSNFSELQGRLKPILNSPSKLQLLAAELEIVLFIRFNKLDLCRNVGHRKTQELNASDFLGGFDWAIIKD